MNIEISFKIEALVWGSDNYIQSKNEQDIFAVETVKVKKILN
jgi:hypothetical protein